MLSITRPRNPYTVVPPAVTYGTAHKEKENNRVVRVSTRVVFGTVVVVALAVAASSVGRVVNTSFVERHNGTDRNRCSRKVRKSYGFSKDWEVHRAATAFILYAARSETSSNSWKLRAMSEASGPA